MISPEHLRIARMSRSLDQRHAYFNDLENIDKELEKGTDPARCEQLIQEGNRLYTKIQQLEQEFAQLANASS